MLTPNQVTALCGRKLLSCRDRKHFVQLFKATFDRKLELEKFDKLIDGTTEAGERMKLWVQAGLTVSHGLQSGVWAAWLPRMAAERETAVLEWGDFGSGTWTEEIPTAPGLYATRDLQGHRARDRRMQLVEGVVRDVTTHCPSHVRSEWQGDWWTKSFPSLPGAL